MKVTTHIHVGYSRDGAKLAKESTSLEGVYFVAAVMYSLQLLGKKI